MSLQQNLQKEIHPGASFSQEQKDLECFPESIGVCATFPSRRASRNCSEGLEETLRDGDANESAIVKLFSTIFARVIV